VVLAAGHGRRFAEAASAGANKLLASCLGWDGVERPVLEHTLRAFSAWRGERVLVVREGCQALIDLGTRHGFEIVFVASAGMGDSLGAAVRARPKADGWLVTLGDMPWVRPATLAQVAAGLVAQTACVPVYQGRWGHPVGFGSSFARPLAALQGDQGGRRLLQGGKVILVEVDDPGVLRDVDVPGDLNGQSKP
jgi:molybdenum cofactor cytidylyltransferase